MYNYKLEKGILPNSLTKLHLSDTYQHIPEIPQNCQIIKSAIYLDI